MSRALLGNFALATLVVLVVVAHGATISHAHADGVGDETCSVCTTGTECGQAMAKSPHDLQIAPALRTTTRPASASRPAYRALYSARAPPA